VLPEESSSFAREWLLQRGLAKDAYVVVGLGARRAKKQPSTEQILRWCNQFKSAWGLDTVFMWTPGPSNDPLYPGDDAVAQPVLDARISYIHPFRGPLKQALGLIWNAKTSVFPDSGLMHFAAASNGGVLGLFAETEISPSPVQWAPRGRRACYLEADKSVEELPDALVFEKVAGLLR
jgi:heptosyltransferase-3